jgi:hypothetical protein
VLTASGLDPFDHEYARARAPSGRCPGRRGATRAPFFRRIVSPPEAITRSTKVFRGSNGAGSASPALRHAWQDCGKVSARYEAANPERRWRRSSSAIARKTQRSPPNSSSDCNGRAIARSSSTSIRRTAFPPAATGSASCTRSCARAARSSCCAASTRARAIRAGEAARATSGAGSSARSRIARPARIFLDERHLRAARRIEPFRLRREAATARPRRSSKSEGGRAVLTEGFAEQPRRAPGDWPLETAVKTAPRPCAPQTCTSNGGHRQLVQELMRSSRARRRPPLAHQTALASSSIGVMIPCCTARIA